MSAQERFGLLMILVVGVVLGAVAFAASSSESDAVALAGCELPTATPDRRVIVESFDDLSQDVVSQAERHVCHEVKEPREKRGWMLKAAEGHVVRLFNGTSTWDVRLRYTLGTYATPSARYLVINVDDPREDVSPLLRPTAAPGAIEHVSLRGRPAEMWRTDDDGLVVRWMQDGLRFEAEVIGSNGSPTRIDTRSLFAFLASVS